MPTLKDLARRTGLSVTQVSRALNDHADVSRETKRRVREAADMIGYAPNLAARRLQSGRSGLVAMIVPPREETAEIGILMESVMALSAECSRRGLQFVLHVLSPGEEGGEAHARMVRAGSIDGVIVTDPVLDDPRIAVLSAAGTPFVVHGRDRDDPPYSFVDIDNAAVGADLAAALADRGCRRVALVDGPADRPYAVRRLAGARSALAARGLELAAHLTGPMTEARGRAAAADLGDADGVVAGNMMLAAGLRAARPGLAIAAHDDGLPGYGPGSVAAPFWCSRAPLQMAAGPLVDTLDAAIAGEVRGTILPHDPVA